MSVFGNKLRTRRIDARGRIFVFGEKNNSERAVIVSNSAIFPYAFVATERGSIGLIKLNKRSWRKQVTHFSNASMQYIDKVINTFFEKKNVPLRFRLLRPPESEYDLLCYEVKPIWRNGE